MKKLTWIDFDRVKTWNKNQNFITTFSWFVNAADLVENTYFSLPEMREINKIVNRNIINFGIINDDHDNLVERNLEMSRVFYPKSVNFEITASAVEAKDYVNIYNKKYGKNNLNHIERNIYVDPAGVSKYEKDIEKYLLLIKVEIGDWNLKCDRLTNYYYFNDNKNQRFYFFSFGQYDEFVKHILRSKNKIKFLQNSQIEDGPALIFNYAADFL